MTDYAKRELKALDRIAKKISDAESHLTKIEDSIDDKNIAPLNTKQLRILNQFLGTQEKSMKMKIRSNNSKVKVLKIQPKITTSTNKKKNLLSTT